MTKNTASGVNVIKLFFFVTDNVAKQAKRFFSGKPFQLGLIFVNKAKPTRVKHSPGILDRVATVKCSGLFGLIAGDK
jgi:hypothetical protein